MQNNNQPIYSLSSQTLTPTNSFYTIGGASPIMCSDHEPSFAPITTPSRGRSGKKAKVSKRKQVKNACTNCQKACKKCDEGRACQRCVKLGIADSCVDSPRKERLKGVKRGPYKKRQRENVNGDMAQFQPKGQETPFYYEQALVWDNSIPTIKQEQQPQYQYRQHHQRQASSSSLSSEFLFNQEQATTLNGYYTSSPPMNQQYYSQSSLHGTPSPLSNSLTDHYTSPMTSSLSASPASSTMILPQDTLQSILSVDDMTLMNLQVPIKQEPIYSDDLMMLPLRDPAPSSPSSFAWSSSTPSPTNTTFAPQLTQAIYQPQQHYIPQQKDQVPMYWDPSTCNYEWFSVGAPQSYM